MNDLTLFFVFSVAGVMLLVLAAFGLGFGRRTKLSESDVRRLARPLGGVGEIVMDADGAAALGRAEGGRFFAARAVGSKVAGRMFHPNDVKITCGVDKKGRRWVEIGFADLGWAPLRLWLPEGPPPHWVAALSDGAFA